MTTTYDAQHVADGAARMLAFAVATGGKAVPLPGGGAGCAAALRKLVAPAIEKHPGSPPTIAATSGTVAAAPAAGVLRLSHAPTLVASICNLRRR